MSKENLDEILIFEWIDYDKALELLFNTYEYWTTNWSNCFLIDENDRIFWISWNLLSHNSFIKVINIKYPWYIVLNNKKRLEHDLFVKDIPTISNWLNSCFINH